MMQNNLPVCLALSVAPHCLKGCIYRRKFRNQTSDNMDRWNSRGGKSGEEKRREDQRGERVRRKKMQVREKIGKSRFSVFPMICGSRGSKSNLAKAAGCGAIWPDEK